MEWGTFHILEAFRILGLANNTTIYQDSTIGLFVQFIEITHTEAKLKLYN